MTIQNKLDDRYGRGSSRRARLTGWIVAGALAATLIAGLAWTTVATSLSSVDVDTTGFDVIDEHAVALTFQVSAPAGATIACALEAQDEEHGVVGWRVVEYPLTEGSTDAFTEQVPTVAPATTGFVNSCWVA